MTDVAQDDVTIGIEPSVEWRDLIAPERADAILETLYGLLLGRKVDPSGRAFADIIRRGRFHEVVDAIVSSAEFSEPALFARLTADCLETGQKFRVDRPVGRGTTERVIEVPWVLSRYAREARVLDVGYGNALWPYLGFLIRLPAERRYGVDTTARRVPGMLGARADVRRLPYRTAALDLVLLVSTLEHIGFDNRRYGGNREDRGGDRETLAEIARVIRPGGRLLVTVPVGRGEDHGWFQQYSVEQWHRLVAAAPFHVAEEEAYRLGDDGWTREPALDRLADLRYGDGCPGARAVLCSDLVRA